MVARLSLGTPASPSRIAAGIEKYENDVKNGAKALVQDVKNLGWSPAGRKAMGKDLKLEGSAIGAEAVGLAELHGLRYPVSKYEFKVSDGLTRGSRIDDPNGYQSLKQQGFKGIVDLTLEGADNPKAAQAAGLHTKNVKILDNAAPTEAQMKQFLDFATNPKNSPCYVHCEAGKGRTGVAVASYRMAVEGWPPQQAIAEAAKFGCTLPAQVQFLEKFGADLGAGKIKGYPKA